MTIAATASQISYAGNGVTVDFPIPFVFDTAADIGVVTTDASGNPTRLSTGYSITGGAGSTGTCTMSVAPAVGTELTLFDDPELTQTADYEANDAFPEDSHERALDRNTRLVKRLHQRVNRAIRVDDGDLSDGDDLLIPISSSRANKFLGFDSAGQPFASDGTGGGDAALRNDLAKAISGNDGARLTGFRRTEAGSVARTLYARLNEVISILDFGPNTVPGTTDMSGALQAAVNAATALGGGTVRIPAGTYRMNSMVTVSGPNGINIVGDGQHSTFVDCGITGAAANPLLLFNGTGAFFLVQGITFRGNGVTGAGGNGNCISVINPGATLAPQHVVTRDVAIYSFAGTGKDETGASMEAAGYFGYKTTGLVWDHTFIYGCRYGIRLKLIENAAWLGGGIDACALTCAYLDTCHAISFQGGQFQSSGSGGAKDGGVYLETCAAITFDGGEAKSCNPALFNLNGTNIYNHNIRISNMYLDQIDSAGGVVCIKANNGARNLTIEDNFFLFVNTITNGKGIEVVQNMSGSSMSGLRIVGNSFQIGSGGTITACIHLNVTSNRVRAPVIQGNTFGFWTGAGSATTITNGILIDGRVEGGVIDSNTFATSTNLTITNAININSANVIALRVLGNEYDTVAGTITNQVVNGGAVSFERNERAFGSLLSGSATYDPPNLADGAGATTTVTVTGAALGDAVENISFSLDLQGITLTGYVSAANTVSVRFQNESGGVLDLASGTLRARVRDVT